MEKIENKLRQWHETFKISENGVCYFLKKYKPESYEIKNEISWLTSNMINSCKAFSVPNIVSSSVKDGYVKMNYIDILNNKSAEEMSDYLIECALEFHSLIKSDKPYLRTLVTKNDYSKFLDSYVETRINSIKSEFDFSQEIVEWISTQIQKLKVNYFSIVHRDLRARHLLFSDKEKPTLIDWEFSNISEPAQDLAKLIYDGVANGLDRNELIKKVVDVYSNDKKISKDQLEQNVLTFMPIIPLEHSMSFINRKPEGYELEVLKDLCYIRTLYEEKH